MIKLDCILLIDDSGADNAFHTLQIKKAKVCEYLHVVESVREGMSYVEQAMSEEQDEGPMPNLIFVDINMPGLTGFDFLTQYTDMHWKLPPGIEVFMLTSSGDPSDMYRSVKSADITGYINKPLTADKVREIVDSYFNYN